MLNKKVEQYLNISVSDNITTLNQQLVEIKGIKDELTTVIRESTNGHEIGANLRKLYKVSEVEATLTKKVLTMLGGMEYEEVKAERVPH